MIVEYGKHCVRVQSNGTRNDGHAKEDNRSRQDTIEKKGVIRKSYSREQRVSSAEKVGCGSKGYGINERKSHKEEVR
jgi:hypothetical protein